MPAHESLTLGHQTDCFDVPCGFSTAHAVMLTVLAVPDEVQHYQTSHTPLRPCVISRRLDFENGTHTDDLAYVAMGALQHVGLLTQGCTASARDGQDGLRECGPEEASQSNNAIIGLFLSTDPIV